MTQVDIDRMWRHADEIAEPRDRQENRIDDIDRMWALFREAVKTAQQLPGPPRTGYPRKSSLPDAPDEISHFGAVLAYIRGETETMPVVPEQSIRPPATAAQVTRMDIVLGLFTGYALNGRRRKIERRKAVWAYASGVGSGRVAASWGIERRALYRLKNDAMADMVRAVSQRAKKNT